MLVQRLRGCQLKSSRKARKKGLRVCTVSSGVDYGRYASLYVMRSRLYINIKRYYFSIAHVKEKYHSY